LVPAGGVRYDRPLVAHARGRARDDGPCDAARHAGSGRRPIDRGVRQVAFVSNNNGPSADAAARIARREASQ